MTSMKDLSGLMFGGIEAPEPVHLVCLDCYPVQTAGDKAVCGYAFEGVSDCPDNVVGEHKCARCLALLNDPGPWPCGH